jgi:hypothetical protein
VQFYTSNFLDGSVKGKGGKTYRHWWFHLGPALPGCAEPAELPSPA